MYCSFCNSKLPEGEAICPICGYVCRPELMQKAEEQVVEAPEEQYEDVVEETVEEAPAAPMSAYEQNRYYSSEAPAVNERFVAPETRSFETPAAPTAQKPAETVINYKEEQDPLDKGLLSLVCGIVSIFFGLLAGIPYNIAGLIFSGVSIKNAKKAIELYPSSNGGKIAVAGKAAGTVGRVLSIISLIINVLSALSVIGMLVVWFLLIILSLPIF